FFLPIITLPRNAAMNSLEYKTELALVKAQDITVKKLTRRNPAMAARLEELKDQESSDAE
ncbi:MAG: hypothetical protein EP297_00195, partial [Gammaproteobacteria bacterium]